MDAKTQKSELTRAAIVGAGLDLAAEQGLEAITLQAVADTIIRPAPSGLAPYRP